MTDDQDIRMQCLELAVKAGTPWNCLTEAADKLTVYVRGIRTEPTVSPIQGYIVKEDGSTEDVRGPIAPADKGVAIEPPTSAYESAQRQTDAADVATIATEAVARGIAVEDPVDRGEPMEEPPRADIYGDETVRRVYNSQANIAAEKPAVIGMETFDPATMRSTVLPPGVANDPRLPLVTM